MTGNTQPRAAYRITIDGVDITPRIRGAMANGRPRLVSLHVSDRQRGEADEVEIRIDDTDGIVEIPRKGVMCRVWIGWEGGALVDKGTFKVDESGHEGPPDTVVIKARSVDLTNQARNRRSRSWHQTTLGAVIGDLAAAQGLKVRISPDLASIAVQHLDQVGESDVHLMTRLAKQHDATATVKGGALIFMRIGGGTTADGKALPSFTIRRSENDTHTYTKADRERYSGVEAEWHDKATGTRKVVRSGSASNAKRLRRVYHSEAEAQQHASAEYRRHHRADAKLSLRLARGDALLSTESIGRVAGWKAEIDATRWLIVSVEHTIDGAGGFSTSVELETPN